MGDLRETTFLAHHTPPWCSVTELRLTTHGEANEIGAKPKSGSLSCSDTNAGRDEVKEDEYHGSGYTKSEDLAEVELLGRDEHSRKRNRKTLN